VYAGDVSGTVTVIWGAPTAGSPPVTGYVIRVTPGSEQVLPATARSITLTGLDPKQAYEIGVRARGTVIDSAEKTLTMKPTQLTLSPPSATVDHAGPVTLTGTVTGPPANGRAYLEQKAPTSATWTRVSLITVDASGTWSLTVNPTATTAYRVSYPALAIGWWPATSAISTITVRHAVTFRASTPSARAGSTVTFTGTVTPATSGVQANLQRYADGAWVTLQSATVAADGSYSFRRAFTRGSWHLRVVTSGGNTIAAGHSPPLMLTIT
jgi:hypothetical protein